MMKPIRGIAIPVVMVFVVVSHLLYVNLLHFNRVQSQRFVNFQQYYQAKIQIMMGYALIKDSIISQDISLELEEAIQQKEALILLDYEVEESIPIDKQHSVYRVKDKLNRNVIIEIYHMLYPVTADISYKIKEPYYISGHFEQQKNQRIEIEQDEAIKQIEHQMQLNQYILLNEVQVPHTLYLPQVYIQENQMLFDKGELFWKIENDEIQIASFVEDIQVSKRYTISTQIHIETFYRVWYKEDTH